MSRCVRAGISFASLLMLPSSTRGGFPVLELNVAEVKLNSGAVTVPSPIARPAIEVTVDKAADGVWFLHGGSHHSVAIEMSDHVILFEAPLGDARTNAVLEATRKTIPNKPIRFVVASHHHFDHSGGLRAAAATDAVLVMPEASRPFFEQAYAAPRTLASDTLAKSGKAGAVLDDPRQARHERRHADRGAPRAQGERPRRGVHRRLPAEGEDPDRGRRVQPAGAGHPDAREHQSQHQEPLGEHRPPEARHPDRAADPRAHGEGRRTQARGRRPHALIPARQSIRK